MVTKLYCFFLPGSTGAQANMGAEISFDKSNPAWKFHHSNGTSFSTASLRPYGQPRYASPRKYWLIKMIASP